jgi:hypothetical protein
MSPLVRTRIWTDAHLAEALAAQGGTKDRRRAVEWLLYQIDEKYYDRELPAKERKLAVGLLRQQL